MGRKGRHARPRRGRWSLVVGVALLLAGLGVVAFPPASKYLSASAQAAMADEYSVIASGAASGAFEAAVDANVRGDYKAASALLSVEGSDVIARLRIPSIDVDLPVYPTSGDRDLRRGAGHLPGTAAPVGGEGTHSAITAHSGMPTARMFDRLPRLEAGDLVALDVLGETLTYKVTGSVVDTPTDGTAHLAAQRGADLLTLVTCTPYGVNTHRLLVTAERTKTSELRGSRMQSGWFSKYGLGMAGAVGIAGLTVMGWKKRKHGGAKK